MVRRRCGRCGEALAGLLDVWSAAALVAPATGTGEEGGSDEVAGGATKHETSKERHGELKGSKAELGGGPVTYWSVRGRPASSDGFYDDAGGVRARSWRCGRGF